MDCVKKVINAGKETLNKVSDMIKLDKSKMLNLTNDSIKVGISTITVAASKNELSQKTITHDVASKLVGLAVYHIALSDRIEKLEASNEKLKKLNFSLTVKLTTMVLVSTALLSGIESLNNEKLMLELAGMAVGIAVHNMFISKFVDKTGTKGDARQMVDDWAIVLTISVATQLVMTRGNLNKTIANLTNPEALKNLISDILGRNVASAVDYA